MEIFSENVIQKSWSAKNLYVPQIRHQVSATAISGVVMKSIEDDLGTMPLRILNTSK